MASNQKQLNPFDKNHFQVMGANELKRLGVPMSPTLEGITPFPRKELAKLKALEPELEGIDVHKLPLLYTTQLPISRGALIDVASSELFLAVPPTNKNGNGGAANTIIALEKLVADYKSLSAEKINSEFLKLMVEKTEGDLKNIKIDNNGDFLKEAAMKKKANFEKLVNDIDSVLKKMHEKGLEYTNIYKKLTVDLEYLNAMQGFISNAIKKVQSVRLDLNKKYASLEHRQQNIELALETTETKNILDQVLSLAKWVFGTAAFGAATFLAAKGEALKILQEISHSPNLMFIGIGAGLVGLGIFVKLSIEMWKAFQKNRFIKIYGKRKEKVTKKAVDYTHNNLKVIGYKATKEAAFAGYLEALQGEVSEKYMIAAFQGEFGAINKIYDRQVDRMLGEHTLGYRFRRFVDMFRRNTERKMDAALSKTAVEVDGSFVDVERSADGENAQPEPKASQ